MSKPKDCPFCGHEAEKCEGKDLGYDYPLYGCVQPDCPCSDMPFVPLEEWDSRPIEDKLNARIAELEEENDNLRGFVYGKDSVPLTNPNNDLPPEVEE